MLLYNKKRTGSDSNRGTIQRREINCEFLTIMCMFIAIRKTTHFLVTIPWKTIKMHSLESKNRCIFFFKINSYLTLPTWNALCSNFAFITVLFHCLEKEKQMEEIVKKIGKCYTWKHSNLCISINIYEWDRAVESTKFINFSCSVQAKPRNELQLGEHEVNIGGLRSVRNGNPTGEVTWL